MTTTQLNQVKRYLASYAAQFTNPELEAFFEDAEDQDAVNPVAGAVAFAFYMLATNALSLTNFRQGETQENEAVIYDRMWARYQWWANKAGFPTALPIFDVTTQRLHYIEFPEETLE